MAYHIKNSIEELIPFLELSDMPWGIKDTELFHVYWNDAAVRYSNIPKNFDIVGRRDSEAPADWSELSEQYAEQDYQVIGKEATVSIIETNYWFGRNHLSPYISDKYPIFLGDKVVGTIWCARPFTLYTPVDYFTSDKARFVSCLAPTDIFSPAELRVIFFLINNRYSSKEIAKLLNITSRTVENHISSIYRKAKVSSLKQFTEYARVIGLDCFLPEEFIAKGIKFI